MKGKKVKAEVEASIKAGKTQSMKITFMKQNLYRSMIKKPTKISK